ncbi:MAG: DUF104 domain-containing protein [candidate division KSB1 bacterium]|nr:DUF104 domain-containing protein [candidate division KSB1 bacterium]MDZ7401333.1 DUF104 domain-containing protein [candidate division KSB1 bacterium]
MTKTVHAIFDGKVFRPEKEVELKINQRYRLRIEPLEKDELIESVEKDSAFDLASLAVKTGITDLATNHDHYLYGMPKKDLNNEK